MLTHFHVVAAILMLGLPALTKVADAGKLVIVCQTQSAVGDKKPTEKNVVPPAAAEPLEETLRKAIKQIQALDAEAAKSDRAIRLPSTRVLTMQSSKSLSPDAMRAIGRAQAKIGDLEEARATWQTALDGTAEIASFDAAEERANLYIEIARAQHEAGEHNEAGFSLRQAVQSARAVKDQNMFPISLPPGLEDRYDPISKKARLLRRIAQLQAETGNKSGSEANFRLAVESAESIKDPLRKTHHLLEIAQSVTGEASASLWTKCLDLALSLADEYPRAKAVEAVIRARLNSLPAEETLAIVADRLKGDFQHFSIWVVADAMASSDKPFPPQAVARLGQLASKADFDRSSKKIKVFQRIAEAQARLGDYDGASGQQASLTRSTMCRISGRPRPGST